jgi:hypothetical protein
MVATTFLYIIIILCYVNKLNSSMSNFGGTLGQPKKNETYSRDFFVSANIAQQVVDFWFWNRLYVSHWCLWYTIEISDVSLFDVKIVALLNMFSCNFSVVIVFISCLLVSNLLGPENFPTLENYWIISNLGCL